ncbi:Intraflagellar transport protein 88-like [Cricetulus griseus]|uniref:Intraflagellar transport protein 88-like n=1 Tax=Cricetulus griseus TaxID=10029 RepID=G3H8J1_CRIGR|nr:Intraflagellar transport protein 88-like [Cricetulus griseus]
MWWWNGPGRKQRSAVPGNPALPVPSFRPRLGGAEDCGSGFLGFAPGNGWASSSGLRRLRRRVFPVPTRGQPAPLGASPEEKIRQLEKKVNELVEESCIANSCGDLKLVLFNLASQYSANEMYAEALNTYQVIVKNKMFSNAGRLKVNMGNIYLKQRNYSKAIKFYRMALDQIPSVHKEMRIKIMQNIGITFIKTGQYSDAINSFEHIMSMAPNLKAGFNLILSCFAIGDREKMKKAFQKLIAVPLEIDEDDKYISPSDDPHTNLLVEAIKNDHLRQMERERKAMAEKYIMTAAKLIAPVIESSFAVGYNWCVEVVKASQYVELANDLEINKAITYLRQKDFNQENEFAQASSYADLAVNSDRYNPSALTNKGNTVFANGDYEKAAEFYKEALRNDSSCTEALYNIVKVHQNERNQSVFPIQYELMEDPNQAIEWLMQLISVVPTDSQALSKLGELYDSEGDKSQAFQYYYERIKSGRDSGGGSRSKREGSAGSDASYVDPLGPQIERPKTAAKKRIDEDDFADEELGDDLLPE